MPKLCKNLSDVSCRRDTICKIVASFWVSANSSLSTIMVTVTARGAATVAPLSVGVPTSFSGGAPSLGMLEWSDTCMVATGLSDGGIPRSALSGGFHMIPAITTKNMITHMLVFRMAVFQRALVGFTIIYMVKNPSILIRYHLLLHVVVMPPAKFFP